MNTRFSDLDLIDPILKSLEAEGYTEPTPIQKQAIPHVLKGRDLLGCAQTGTGKTAAFAIPILQLLAKTSANSQTKTVIRTLILTPTRELAAQIGESFNRYGKNLKIANTVIFGGVGQGAQASSLRKGVDIVVATPGRLLDLIEQKLLTLEHLEIFVLDEADRMLDMGFIHDVKRVIQKLPKKRQTLFFSATMPSDIQRLADSILTNPQKVEVTPIATTAEKIDQIAYLVDGQIAKRGLLEHVLKNPALSRVLVFTRTKHGADKVARFLNTIQVHAEAIHGNKSQNNRVAALDNFKKGKTRVLVATDIAARGIDIDEVSHVINFEIPNVPETYVHRIGRTARAGAEGQSLSFVDIEERPFLRAIEKLTRQEIRIETDNPFASGVFVAPERPPQASRDSRRPSPQQRRGHPPASGRSNANSNNGRRPQSNLSQKRAHSHDAKRLPQSNTKAQGTRQHPNDAKIQSRSAPSQRPAQRNSQPHRHTRPPANPSKNTQSQQKESARPSATTTSTVKKKPWWKRIISDD